MRRSQADDTKISVGSRVYRLSMTCEACPEQYDAYLFGELTGYLRLRGGVFNVTFPNVQGETVWSAVPSGSGAFTADERLPFLVEAVRRIDERRELRLSGNV